MRPAAALVYLASVARVAAIEYKPAAQRGVQNSRGLVPPEAERVGRTVERDVVSGEMYRKTKKARI